MELKEIIKSTIAGALFLLPTIGGHQLSEAMRKYKDLSSLEIQHQPGFSSISYVDERNNIRVHAGIVSKESNTEGEICPQESYFGLHIAQATPIKTILQEDYYPPILTIIDCQNKGGLKALPIYDKNGAYDSYIEGDSGQVRQWDGLSERLEREFVKIEFDEGGLHVFYAWKDQIMLDRKLDTLNQRYRKAREHYFDRVVDYLKEQEQFERRRVLRERLAQEQEAKRRNRLHEQEQKPFRNPYAFTG